MFVFASFPCGLNKDCLLKFEVWKAHVSSCPLEAGSRAIVPRAAGTCGLGNHWCLFSEVSEEFPHRLTIVSNPGRMFCFAFHTIFIAKAKGSNS